MESLWTTAAASFKTEGWQQAASCDNHKTVTAKTSNKPFKEVEKSRAPRPYYVDHHEAVSHQDVTTDYLAQDTKGSVIITVSWNPGLPCK